MHWIIGARGVEREGRFYLLYNPRRIDHNIYRTQVRAYLGHHVRDRLFVPHVDSVELDGYAGRRVEFGGRCVPEVLLHVQEGDGFGTGFGERLGHVPT